MFREFSDGFYCVLWKKKYAPGGIKITEEGRTSMMPLRRITVAISSLLLLLLITSRRTAIADNLGMYVLFMVV